MSAGDERVGMAPAFDTDAARFVPEAELGLGGRLCRAVAAVQRAAAQVDIAGLRQTTKLLHDLAVTHRFEGVAWHARALHELQLSDSQSQVRLYELLDGLEAALEHTLDRLRLH
jgi:hypothetical protein